MAPVICNSNYFKLFTCKDVASIPFLDLKYTLAQIKFGLGLSAESQKNESTKICATSKCFTEKMSMLGTFLRLGKGTP